MRERERERERENRDSGRRGGWVGESVTSSKPQLRARGDAFTRKSESDKALHCKKDFKILSRVTIEQEFDKVRVLFVLKILF